MESYTPEKPAEMSEIPKARETLAALAELRRKDAALRLSVLALSRGEQDSAREAAMQAMQKEASGEIPMDAEMAAGELDKEELFLKERAGSFAAAAPGYAAYLLGRVAKLKQAAGVSFETEYAEASALSAKAGMPRRPDDIVPPAQLLGIARRRAARQGIPTVPEMAMLALVDKKALQDIALVLSEQDREAFLSALPEDTRRAASARMDRELSTVLRKPVPEEEAEQKILRERVKSDLMTAISSAEPSLDTALVKLLSGALAELGEPEAKAVLKDATAKSLTKSATGERRAMSYAARLVRTLAETDAFAGSESAVKFMGQEKLHPRYFKYFRDYLHTY